MAIGYFIKRKCSYAFNEGMEDLLMLQIGSPSFDCDTALENLCGVAGESKVPGREPNFLRVVVWLRNYEYSIYLPTVPVRIQGFLSFLLAATGRLIDYKAFYKTFSRFDA